MGRKYRLLSRVPGEGPWTFNADATGKTVESAYPNCAKKSGFYAGVAWRVAREIVDGKHTGVSGGEMLPFEYLFVLARELMACTRAEYRRTPGMAREFAPYAIVFVETLTFHHSVPDADQIDWEDDEEVMETFVDVYSKVRFAADENLVETVIKEADALPLRIKGLGEKTLRFLSFAYHLQTRQGDVPIALPVETMGKLLDCAPTFVSRLTSNAVREGFLIVVDPTYNKAKGKAKTYRFNVVKLKAAEKPKRV